MISGLLLQVQEREGKGEKEYFDLVWLIACFAHRGIEICLDLIKHRIHTQKCDCITAVCAARCLGPAA